MPPLFAIAAMSLNRVIGAGGQIPWHLPEDFQWFKRATLGGTLIMGRRTYESIGRPLPGRTTVVLTRSAWAAPGVAICPAPDALPLARLPAPHFVCGGAEIYRLLLPACAELLLTQVKREVAGDAFFPPFEDRFERVETIRVTPEFDIQRWRNRAPRPLAGESAD